MTNLEWQELEATVSKMTPEEKQRLLALLNSSFIEPPSAETEGQFPPDLFESELAKVAFDAPALPSDFLRADIYIDHD